MWQRFTERARKVIFYAQEEAQKLGEGYVSTEHILLGLIREPDSVAARVLDMMNIQLGVVRRELEKQLPPGDMKASQDMTLTPRAKRVIDLAYNEASSLDNNYIGTEHLLLGLIREAEGLGGRVLATLGASLLRAREHVRELQLQDKETRQKEPVPTAHAGPSETLSAMRSQVLKDGVTRGVLFVGTHDYLWAFLEREDCVACRSLVKSGIDVESLKAEIAKMRNLDPRNGVQPKDDPIASSAHAEANQIARAMGSTRTSTGHHLLAMIVLSWSSVYLMMSNLGIAYEHIWLLVAQEGDED